MKSVNTIIIACIVCLLFFITLGLVTTRASAANVDNFEYVVRVVGAECRGESEKGILAVCQCIADTAERTKKTPYQVVTAKNQYAKPLKNSNFYNNKLVRGCCTRVFVNGERPFSDFIEYFYSTNGGFYSKWHESLNFCFAIGSHRFFKR